MFLRDVWTVGVILMFSYGCSPDGSEQNLDGTPPAKGGAEQMRYTGEVNQELVGRLAKLKSQIKIERNWFPGVRTFVDHFFDGSSHYLVWLRQGPNLRCSLLLARITSRKDGQEWQVLRNGIIAGSNPTIIPSGHGGLNVLFSGFLSEQPVEAFKQECGNLWRDDYVWDLAPPCVIKISLQGIVLSQAKALDMKPQSHFAGAVDRTGNLWVLSQESDMPSIGSEVEVSVESVAALQVSKISPNGEVLFMKYMEYHLGSRWSGKAGFPKDYFIHVGQDQAVHIYWHKLDYMDTTMKGNGEIKSGVKLANTIAEPNLPLFSILVHDAEGKAHMVRVFRTRDHSDYVWDASYREEMKGFWDKPLGYGFDVVPLGLQEQRGGDCYIKVDYFLNIHVFRFDKQGKLVHGVLNLTEARTTQKGADPDKLRASLPAVIAQKKRMEKVIHAIELQHSANAFYALEGHYPTDLKELEQFFQQGSAQVLPKLPTGWIYRYDSKTGNVAVQDDRGRVLSPEEFLKEMGEKP